MPLPTTWNITEIPTYEIYLCFINIVRYNLLTVRIVDKFKRAYFYC